ncbi:MAG: hypothetical protein E7417_06190, partial [Ruminococcaceae bacterium]|nr:hypothetical protein [Oscillospiraceae bacterium]
SKQYSETTASQIDKEVESIINGQYKEAKSLLTENIGRLHSVANALLEKEVIDGAEFLKYFNQEGEKENETSK